jgi:hypothetical protein
MGECIRPMIEEGDASGLGVGRHRSAAPATMSNAHATILRTSIGSSCRWLRMIPSLGTNAPTDTLPGSGCVRAARRPHQTALHQKKVATTP